MTDTGSVRVAFRVAGRVQGVGFRWFVTRTAGRLGLSGWVRNRPDGDVDGEVEGAAAVVEELLEALAGGPVGARVDRLDVRRALPLAGGAGFVVRR